VEAVEKTGLYEKCGRDIPRRQLGVKCAVANTTACKGAARS